MLKLMKTLWGAFLLALLLLSIQVGIEILTIGLKVH